MPAVRAPRAQLRPAVRARLARLAPRRAAGANAGAAVAAAGEEVGGAELERQAVADRLAADVGGDVAVRPRVVGPAADVVDVGRAVEPGRDQAPQRVARQRALALLRPAQVA